MSFFFVCSVVGGLILGFGLDVAIRRLPLALFPELRSAQEASQIPPVSPKASGQTPQLFRRAQFERTISTVVVMLLGVVILVWTTSQFGLTWSATVHTAWLCVLVVLAGIDLRQYLLPDLLTYGLLGLAVIACVAGLNSVGPVQAICGAILGYAVLWGLNAGYRRLRRIDGFGGGDFKMMASLGGWLGPAGVIDVLTLSSVMALVCSATFAMLTSRRLSLQSRIPFGPFLAVAAAALMVSQPNGDHAG